MGNIGCYLLLFVGLLLLEGIVVSAEVRSWLFDVEALSALEASVQGVVLVQKGVQAVVQDDLQLSRVSAGC